MIELIWPNGEPGDLYSSLYIKRDDGEIVSIREATIVLGQEVMAIVSEEGNELELVCYQRCDRIRFRKES